MWAYESEAPKCPLSRLDFEIAQLARATQLIAEGEQRVARQRALIDDLRARGVASSEGDKLLGMLQKTLTLWKDHRGLIEDAVARLDQALSPAPRSGDKS